MGLVHNMENAEATFYTQSTTTVVDRVGDDVEMLDWAELVTLPVRFESETTIESLEAARFTAESPGVFVEPDRIDEELAADHTHLASGDWPFVQVADRVEVDGEEYTATTVSVIAIDERSDADAIKIELERT